MDEASEPDRTRGNLAVLSTLRRRFDQSRIPCLDGLRAVAVFLVILYHFGLPGVSGPLGVEMFFTLSGFLITWLLLRERQETGRVSFLGFYKRRARRLFPAFYVYWFIGLVIYLLRRHPVPWGSVFASALYVQDYHTALWGFANGEYLAHTWSLSIEEQFYLVWPLLFSCLCGDLRRLSRVLIWIIIADWLYRATLYFGLSVGQTYVYSAFDTRLDQLAIGCLLAVTLFRGSFGGLWRVLTMNAMMVPLFLGLIFVSAFYDRNAFYHHSLGYAVEPLLMAALIVQVVYFADQWAGRVFNGPIVSYLGKISYSLYLYQGLTVFTAKRLTEGWPLVVQLSCTVGVTVGFAALSFHLVERRFRSRGRGDLQAPGFARPDLAAANLNLAVR